LFLGKLYDQTNNSKLSSADLEETEHNSALPCISYGV
jgi:hypothetical protein